MAHLSQGEYGRLVERHPDRDDYKEFKEQSQEQRYDTDNEYHCYACLRELKIS